MKSVESRTHRCGVLQYTLLIEMQCIAVLQCVAVLQCYVVAVCCSVAACCSLQSHAHARSLPSQTSETSRVLQCVAVCCSVLQCMLSLSTDLRDLCRCAICWVAEDTLDFCICSLMTILESQLYRHCIQKIKWYADFENF